MHAHRKYWHEKKQGFDLLRYGPMTNKGSHQSVFTRHVKPLEYNDNNFNGENYMVFTGISMYDKAPITVLELFKCVHGKLRYFICHELGTNGVKLYWPLMEKRPNNLEPLAQAPYFDYTTFTVKNPFAPGHIIFYIPLFAYANLHEMSEHPGLGEISITGTIFDYPLSEKFDNKQWFNDFAIFLSTNLHVTVNDVAPHQNNAHNFAILEFRPYGLKAYDD